MNVENINKVADAIEKHSIADLGFNMGDYISRRRKDRSGHNCNTKACIAGWSYAVGHKGNLPARWSREHYEEARGFLGLSFGQSLPLFIPSRDDIGSIAPNEAVAVLRHLAKTGKVDWSVKP